MVISIQNAGKKFGNHWIFKEINIDILYGEKIAILGANGSGKSTLLKCISHQTALNTGDVFWKNSQNNNIEETNIYKHYSLISPSLELIEELTLLQFLNLHFSFKKIIGFQNVNEIISIVQLEKSKNKTIKYFSSGMKQRVKLLVAFFTQNDVLLLDEPTSNLDELGIKLYQKLITEYHFGRSIIIASNISQEYEFCSRRIQL